MLLDLIKERKSVREYQDKKIPNEDLKKILQAGYLAPSWMNSQPWKFILVENQETKDLSSELSSKQHHVKNDTALDKAKAYTNVVTDTLNKKTKNYYDIEFFLTTKEDSDVYPVIGYHHKGAKEFSWSNVGEQSE